MELLSKYSEAWASGLGKTAWLAGLSVCLGIPLGLFLGWLGSALPRAIGLAVGFMSFFFAGTPVLVMLLWLHFPLQRLLEIDVRPDVTALFTLVLVLAFSLAQAVRLALTSFPQEMITAGRVSGLGERTIFYRITLPLLLRQLAPTVLTLIVLTIHGTLFASLISVDELLRTTQRINAVEYRPIELYTILAGFFWLICLPLQYLAKILGDRAKRLLALY